jgi:hypothetical protein
MLIYFRISHLVHVLLELDISFLMKILILIEIMLSTQQPYIYLIFQISIDRNKIKNSDYLHREMQRILKKGVETSSIKYICITSINFSIFLFKKH